MPVRRGNALSNIYQLMQLKQVLEDRNRADSLQAALANYIQGKEISPDAMARLVLSNVIDMPKSDMKSTVDASKMKIAAGMGTKADSNLVDIYHRGLDKPPSAKAQWDNQVAGALSRIAGGTGTAADSNTVFLDQNKLPMDRTPTPGETADLQKKQADAWEKMTEANIWQRLMKGEQVSPAESLKVKVKSTAQPKSSSTDINDTINLINQRRRGLATYLGLPADQGTMEIIAQAIQEQGKQNDPYVRSSMAEIARSEELLRQMTPQEEASHAPVYGPPAPNNKIQLQWPSSTGGQNTSPSKIAPQWIQPDSTGLPPDSATTKMAANVAPGPLADFFNRIPELRDGTQTVPDIMARRDPTKTAVEDFIEPIPVAPPEGAKIENIPVAPQKMEIELLNSHPVKAVSDTTAKYEKYINEAAQKYKIDPWLLSAIIFAESSGRPQVQSSANAHGLMQLQPDTARAMGVDDIYDPRQNIMGGARYLRELLDRFQDINTALAAYNAGPTKVARYLKETGELPPYEETRNYVDKVMGIYDGFFEAKRKNANKKPKK